MNARLRTFALLTFLCAPLLSAQALADEDLIKPDHVDVNSASGQVTLPLDQYQMLLQQAATQPLPAPSAYAVGASELNIEYIERDSHITATVTATVSVETFVEEWVLVGLLDPGAALEAAAVDGVPVQLVRRPEGLFWLANGRRKATLTLRYHADARRSETAWISALPIPAAAATRFTLNIPARQIDLAVAPAANLVQDEIEGVTHVTGTASGSSNLMVSWRTAIDQEYALNQARYKGELAGAAVHWQGRIEAEVLTASKVSVPLISTSVTLVSVTVDGDPATIFSEDGVFYIGLSGLGPHVIGLSFQSPVAEPDGMPTTRFNIPVVPVSAFELLLPGEKLVSVTPETQVASGSPSGGGEPQTTASFYLPLSSEVNISWMEAIPQDIDVEKRASAVVYNGLHAAEGVLYGIASIAYEITRGDTNVLEFSLPIPAQVNRVMAPANSVADWIEIAIPDDPGNSAPQRRYRVFLNRAVSGEFVLDIEFEQLLEDLDQAVGGDAIVAPLVRALDVARQKGMIALLSSADLALSPASHAHMSEVGENQLPAFFRNRLTGNEAAASGLGVSHTFKYHSQDASLSMKTVAPERAQGKFNAVVDTLVSIGEVTMSGQVSIENDVKSGVLRDLGLWLPADVNILSVTGPSIRSHEITQTGARQHVAIAFTREMDGLFRIELHYERIMVDGASQTTVPRVEVEGADVEHGRIAIEALAALEVQPGRVEQLSTLEVNELPRQLILKTTNPILLAYKYVHADQTFALELRITRHAEIDVQVAAIDAANYTTLYTTDGLAVTRARFEVRNSRRQFLRLTLPPGSEIWSVFVNGNAQKPALIGDEDHADRNDVLVKMINSSSAFPVELVYATTGSPMGAFGTLAGTLPRPDMIVTRSTWDVYVPSEPVYRQPETNMRVDAQQVVAAFREATAAMLGAALNDVVSGEPLRIELPTEGLLYRFAKLYANQAAEEAYFSLRYVRSGASKVGAWLSILATLVLWAGIALLTPAGASFARSAIPQLSDRAAWTLIATGGLVLMASFAALGARYTPAAGLSLIVAALLGAYSTWQWRHSKAPLDNIQK